MGRAPSLLGRPRAVGFAALLVGLCVYYALAPRLPAHDLGRYGRYLGHQPVGGPTLGPLGHDPGPGTLPVWGDVAFFGFVLIPAVMALVWLALPLRRARGLPLVALAFGAAAAALASAGVDTAANFAKLAAIVLLGWWFLSYFESVWWVVLVACIIPWVDAYSVWRGPTGDIVEHKPGLFAQLSIAFTPLGEHGAARLGLPDILFFALFLAAAARFGLRAGWTWVGLTASFGLTIALAVAFNVSGLPALPGISLGFLLPNLDLLWRRRHTASG